MAFVNKMCLGNTPTKDREVPELKVFPEVEYYVSLFLELTQGISRECVLQGNILLNMLLPNEARATKDLDFKVQNTKVYEDVIVPRLKKYGETCISSGFADDYRLNNMVVDERSGGIKVYKDGKVVFAVDISVPSKDIIGVKEYQLRDVKILGSSIERIIADKVCATLSPKCFRRLKDFYDLYIISKSEFSVNYEGVYKLCIEGGADLNLMAVRFCDEDVWARLDYAWEKFQLYKVLGDDTSNLPKPKFSELAKEVQRVYNAIIKMGC